MIRTSLSVLLFTFSIYAFSQKINQDTQLPKNAVFKNFESFNLKTPTSIKEFSFENRTSKQIWSWGGTEFEIKFADEKIKKKYINDSIWAVSDSKNFFINNKLVSVNKGFDKLEKMDFPISYFVAYIIMRDENEERAALASMFGAVGGGILSIPYKRVIAIDMRTGEVLRMNEAGFTKLLKNDNELMEKYKLIRKEKDNEQAVFSILDNYNLKYQTTVNTR